MTHRSALLLGVCALGLMSTNIARADPACSTIVPTDVNPGTDGSNTVSGGTSVACTVGPVTFSNFSYMDAGGDPGVVVDMIGTTVTPGTSWGIVLNPNLIGNVVEDIHLEFEVTSTVPLTEVTLDNSGSAPSGIQEVVCSSAGVNLMTGACTSGSSLANFAVNASVMPSNSATFAPETSIYIWKDINVGLNGHISAFTQDYVAAAPEPASLALLGAGLIGIALLRRRDRK